MPSWQRGVAARNPTAYRDLGVLDKLRPQQRVRREAPHIGQVSPPDRQVIIERGRRVDEAQSHPRYIGREGVPKNPSTFRESEH
jgi:hypothetical protein